MSLLGPAYLFVIATTIWVWADAGGRDWSHDRFANRRWKWVVGCLFLWIIAFPVYLAHRGKAPVKGAATPLRQRGVLPPELQSGVHLAPATAAAPQPVEVPKPGWYVDPDDSQRLRFWDGNSWQATTAKIERS